MLSSSRNHILVIVLAFTTNSLFVSADIICPEEPGPGEYLFPHQNCSLFYVCEHGGLTILECPPDLYFNPIVLVCDFPQNVPECIGGTRPPTTSTTRPTELPTTEYDTTIEPEEPTTEAETTPEATTPEPWLVIQRRGAPLEAGEIRQDFNKNWYEYQDGFGDLNKDFWLGLAQVASVTMLDEYELLVEMTDFSEFRRWAHYDLFKLDLSDDYRLFVSGFTGNTVDGLAYHNGSKFYTLDHDDGNSCAERYGAGWWYNDCWVANLNARYYESFTTVCNAVRWEDLDNVCWGSFDNLAFVEMKIKKRI